MVSRTCVPRLLAMVTLQADPDLAVLEVLLLPDRHRLFQRVDRETARLEGFAAMGRGDRDHHAGLADLQGTEALCEGDPADDRPALADGAADLAHLGQRHGAVRLVFEELHAPAARLVAQHSREQGPGASA